VVVNRLASAPDILVLAAGGLLGGGLWMAGATALRLPEARALPMAVLAKLRR
jgi:hypothetical protein